MYEATPQIIKTRNIDAELVASTDSTNRPYVSREKSGFSIHKLFKGILRGGKTNHNRPFVSVGPDTSGMPDKRVTRTPTGGRTLVDAALDKRAIWGGKYGEEMWGIYFGSRDFKGVRHENHVPTFEEDRNTPSGVRVRGFKDSVGLTRIDKVSKFFLEHGLPTEVTVNKHELQEVLVNGRTMPIQKWKETYIRQLLKLKETTSAEEYEEHIPRQIKYLQENKFFITDRDLQVPERIRDWGRSTKEQTQRQLANIFNWAYTVGQVSGSGIVPGTEPLGKLIPDPTNDGKPRRENLDSSKEEDLLLYLSEWLPVQMGTFLGRMHALDVVHEFTHDQNWSQVGTLYDLDSVHGAAFKDTLTQEEMDHLRSLDFANTCEVIISMFITHYDRGQFSHIDKLFDGISTALKKFYTAYFQQMKSALEKRQLTHRDDLQTLYSVPSPENRIYVNNLFVHYRDVILERPLSEDDIKEIVIEEEDAFIDSIKEVFG